MAPPGSKEQDAKDRLERAKVALQTETEKEAPGKDELEAALKEARDALENMKTSRKGKAKPDEVAFETAVLGILRPGYRCFSLRSPRFGTRIRLASLFVHIEKAEEASGHALAAQLQQTVLQQQQLIERQARTIREQECRIHSLEAQLLEPPGASPHGARSERDEDVQPQRAGACY